MRRTLIVCVFVGLAGATGSLGETTREKILTEGKNLYSQGNEERIVRHFFDDRRDGFFLDVGAFHWKEVSTTLYLEKHLGWSGIAVDAQSRFASGYEKNRPKTKFFSYLVTDHTGDTETFYLAGYLSSVEKEHFESFPDAKVREPKAVQVPTITLNDLLDRNGVKKVDFLSMDIEGAEPMALAGFDIERFRPELVCVEVGSKTAKKVNAYFESHGYGRIDAYLKYDFGNWYYAPKKSRKGEASASAGGLP
jgi:FkbM family methyltransferase